MPERTRGAGSGFLPLVLLWLAVHAVLLAALLGAKFLLTKTAVLVLLLVGTAVFVFTRIRALPRKLTHSPVA
jgi:hypothetical protein